jgi:hypothetical protein
MPAFMKAALAALLVPSLVSATPLVTPQCQPAPVVKPVPGLAPNSTYTSDAEPPARFLYMPKGYMRVKFGQAAIDENCGVPPCGMIFLGCVRDDLVVLPDPSHPDFAKITRHEIAHFNGWPASHGD